MEGDDLVFTVTLNAAASADVETELYAFGYRADRPFGEMPKIHVTADRSGHKVFERRQGMPADSVNVTPGPGQIEVRIPLAVLGNPERLFFSADAKAGAPPLDTLPWVRCWDLSPHGLRRRGRKTLDLRASVQQARQIVVYFTSDEGRRCPGSPALCT